MKLILTICFFALCISLVVMPSCMRPNENWEESEVVEAVPVEEYVVPEDTLWTAFGNEPGWRLMILSYDNDSLSYQLLANYGQELYVGRCLMQDKSAEGNLTYTLSDENQSSGIAKFSMEKCIDDADEEFTHKLTLTWKENQWNGCAINNFNH